jgi:type II secretory pathway component GspD/PulD (secretin)
MLLALAAAIVWFVGFSPVGMDYLSRAVAQSDKKDEKVPPAPADPNTTNPNTADPNTADPNGSDPNEANTESRDAPPTATESKPEGDVKPAAPNEPDRRRAPGGRGPDRPGSGETKEDEDPNQVSLNLKDVNMKDIIEKLAKWTGKVVIPDDEVMKLKLTIYAPDKLHRDEALNMIYRALREKGYLAESNENVITLKPIAQAKAGRVPVIPPEEPLASLSNREQMVQRFWHLQNYSSQQMYALIQPLVGEYGYVSADEASGMLTAIDTVSNLMRIEQIIQEFDVPQAQQTVSEIIPVENGDPVEIVQLLRVLMGGEADGSSRSSSSRYSSSRYRPTYSSSRRSSSSGGSGSSVFIGASQQPVTLIPEPKRKWIIVRASAQDLQTIHEWMNRLDRTETVESEYETLQLTFADPREVAQRIEDALGDLPGAELGPNVVIRPLEQSRQIMIFGREDLRDMIKKLVLEIDMPPGTFEEKTFDLKHADADQIKQNIDNLYEEQSNRNRYTYIYRSSSSSGRSSDTVRAIAFPAMQQVTVIASPENMRKIEKQILEWDQPLDVDQVKPRIIELRNSDPVQMTQLLTRLFTEDQDSTSNFFRFIFSDMEDSKKKIIGPLYGQLTFEEVPGTRKIIVISKIPQAYDVVEKLVEELDRQEMAEVPVVVTVKYADPEALAERLNALFNETGTNARIRMEQRGLSDYSIQTMGQGNSNNNNNNNNNNGQQGNADEYTPWWNSGASRRTDQEPISNVIGRVRFIPDTHSKSILVLAPPEYQDDIKKTIEALDVPGKQVMVKAVVIMVDHARMTSLGIQLSSNPAAFGPIGENSVTTLNQLAAISSSGTAAGNSAAGLTGTGTIAGVSADVYALVDFLAKNMEARILNEQTLWTKDNEESDFFKGDIVSIQTESSLTANGLSQQSLEPTPVGMTLRIRPSITPENNVDMIVNVELSQLKDELVNEQPVRSMMNSTTQMIVADGETLMLGGILFQRDSIMQRKVPGLGDIPLLGALFRHNETNKANSELIVFITPYVTDDGKDMVGAAHEQMVRPMRELQDIRAELEASLAELKEKKF